MTVIATVLSASCVAYASDSFLTSYAVQPTLTRRKRTRQDQTKLVRVEKLRGVMGYWGLARHGSWSTLDWLRSRTTDAGRFTPEEFARELANDLSREIGRRVFKSPLQRGIGIHFTAFEYVGDYWVPELFLIMNYDDAGGVTYNKLYPDGVRCRRETYHAIFGEPHSSTHGDGDHRRKVHKELLAGRIIVFHNGDPVLFNPGAQAVQTMTEGLRDRGELVMPNTPRNYRALARIPIQLVSDVQRGFTVPSKRRVGGKIHDLSVTSGGLYRSDSGD